MIYSLKFRSERKGVKFVIKLLRIDHRLLHGQVAYSWYGYLGVNAILIANDRAATNDLMRTTLNLAKPPGSKLIIKSVQDAIDAIKSGKADKYNLFIVVSNVDDAYTMASSLDCIHLVNVGGIEARADTHRFHGDSNINLSDEDERKLRKLMEMGKKVELQMVPSETVKTL